MGIARFHKSWFYFKRSTSKNIQTHTQNSHFGPPKKTLELPVENRCSAMRIFGLVCLNPYGWRKLH